MADPLSVAASVAGLLTVAGQVYNFIHEFVSHVGTARQSARDALITIEDMRMILASIKHLLDGGLARVPDQRKRMIHISTLVVIFRECIISFSELEAIISDLAIKAESHRSTMSRLKWVFKEEKFWRCIQRLDSQKASLSAMLSILHCESDNEAQLCLQTLQDNFTFLVRQNQAILRRIDEFNPHLPSGTGSVRFFEDDASNIRSATATRRPNSFEMRNSMLPASDVQLLGVLRHSGWTSDQLYPVKDFETTLNATRVYRHAQADQCDNSLNSSNIRTHGWSALSDLSLSDISAVSVIALPISLDEINGIGANLTFTNILCPPAPKIVPTAKPFTTSRNTFSIPYNIVVLGDANANKYALTIQFCYGNFGNTFDVTIPSDFKKHIVVDGHVCLLEILDTTAQDQYWAQRDEYIKGGHGFVVMYSICSRQSYERIRRYETQIARILDLSSPACAILVGNHCDLGMERQVSKQEGATLAEQLGWGFREVSAEKDSNVDEPFEDVVRMIRQRRGI